MKVRLRKVKHYGNIRIIAGDKIAETLTELMGRKTFREGELTAMKKLGYQPDIVDEILQ